VITQDSLLGAEEERDLAARIAMGRVEGQPLRGDAIAARNRLVESHLRLVHAVCRDYAGRGVAYEDLYQEACCGLIEAAEKFDASHRTRFARYAPFLIRQAVRDTFSSRHMIYIPLFVIKLISKWKNAEARLGRRWGHTPTQEEVAEEVEFDDEAMEFLRSGMRANCVNNHGMMKESRTFEVPPHHEDAVSDRDAYEYISLLVSISDEPDKSILTDYYGLNGHEAATLLSIGRRLGYKASTIQNMRDEAIENIRRRLL
jgi:RNA polymerase primary sigma factor